MESYNTQDAHWGQRISTKTMMMTPPQLLPLWPILWQSPFDHSLSLLYTDNGQADRAEAATDETTIRQLQNGKLSFLGTARRLPINSTEQHLKCNKKRRQRSIFYALEMIGEVAISGLLITTKDECPSSFNHLLQSKWAIQVLIVNKTEEGTNEQGGPCRYRRITNGLT